METVILVIHILLGLALVGVVLMQRSEGGALGIGGGGGGGGLLSGRGAAGALVRTTIIIGSLFIATSLALTTLATQKSDRLSIAEKRAAPVEDTNAPNLGEDLTGPLDMRGTLDLGGDEEAVADVVDTGDTTPPAPAEDTSREAQPDETSETNP